MAEELTEEEIEEKRARRYVDTFDPFEVLEDEVIVGDKVVPREKEE